MNKDQLTAFLGLWQAINGSFITPASSPLMATAAGSKTETSAASPPQRPLFSKDTDLCVHTRAEMCLRCSPSSGTGTLSQRRQEPGLVVTLRLGQRSNARE